MHFTNYLKPVDGCFRFVSLIEKKMGPIRLEISNIFRDDTAPIETINRLLEYYDIYPFNNKELTNKLIDNNSNSNLWAFNYLGLPNYSSIDEERLIIRDSNRFKCIKDPEERALVLYISGNQTRYVKHRGVINSIKEGNVKVISKWRKDDPCVYIQKDDAGFYIHNLELTRIKDGDYVMFFKNLTPS